MDLLALAADEAERQRRRRQQPSRAVPRFATPAQQRRTQWRRRCATVAR
jgi:hypothetical protein